MLIKALIKKLIGASNGGFTTGRRERIFIIGGIDFANDFVRVGQKWVTLKQSLSVSERASSSLVVGRLFLAWRSMFWYR
jgi:hypothetical protein